MSTFKPWQIYKTALPILKPGHLIHTGPDFDKGYLQVVTVRHARKKVPIAGAQTTLYDLVVGTKSAFENLHGNLKKNRIVHLQYVALDQVTPTYLWWLTQPLMSRDVDDDIDSNRVPLDQPMELDRWSYDDSQYLRIKQYATQNYYVIIEEYEVVEYPGKPDRPFLHIFANGQAQFVEAGQTPQSVSAYEKKTMEELKKLRRPSA